MDRDAFESVYQRFYPRVVAYLSRSFHLSYDDASDLAQDVFIRVYDSVDRYQGESSWTYLAQVAKLVALNRIRAQNALKRNASAVVIDAEAARLVSGIHATAAPDEQIATRELSEQLRLAIDALPAATRSVLLL